MTEEYDSDKKLTDEKRTKELIEARGHIEEIAARTIRAVESLDKLFALRDASGACPVAPELVSVVAGGLYLHLSTLTGNINKLFSLQDGLVKDLRLEIERLEDIAADPR